MLKKIFSLLLVFLVFAAMWSEPVFAASEYYTYGGFKPVTMAFENAARIFNASSYMTYIFIFTLFGMFIGGSMAIFRLATGAGKSALSWLLPIIIGYGLFLGFFLPKDTLFVYDPVLNQNKAVGSLPIGVVKVASGINSIERFIVDLIDNNAAMIGPVQIKYSEHGGSLGASIVHNSAASFIEDATQGKQLTQYINDCVVFELTRPGSTMSINTLMKPPDTSETNALMVEFEKAASLANYTVSYKNDANAGEPVSCKASYDQLKAYYTAPANFNKPLSNACGSNHLLDFSRCQQVMGNLISAGAGIDWDPRSFVSGSYIASVTAATIGQAGMTGVTSALGTDIANAGQKAGVSSVFGVGEMLNTYVAYVIMLIPLLAMFVPTPLWSKAVGLMISLLLWCMVVRSLDCILFHQWVSGLSEALSVALGSAGASASGPNFGLEAHLQIPTVATKYLGSFGLFRNGVFLLATVITGALFKFSDSSMSRLSATMGKSVGNVGGSHFDDLRTSKKMSDEASHALAQGVALQGGSKGVSDYSWGNAVKEATNSAVGRGVADSVGGGAGNAAGLAKATAERSTHGDIGRVRSTTNNVAQGDATNKGAATTAAVNVLGGDGKIAYGLAKAETEYNKGTTEGKDKAVAVAREAFGFQGGRDDYAAMMSEMKSIKDFSDSAGLKSVADKYFGGGEKGMAGAARFLKQASEVSHAGQYANTSTLAAAFNGDAIAAGFSGGKASATTTMQNIQDQDAKLAMLRQEAGEEIKSDPNLYQTDKNLRGNAIEVFDKQAGKSGGANPTEEKAIDKTLQQAEQNLNKGDLNALKNNSRQAMAVGALLGKSVDQLTKDDIGRARGAVQQAREKGAARNAVRNALRAPESAENKLAATLGNEQWRQANGGEAAFGKMQQKPVQRADGSTATQYSWTDQSGTRYTAMATEDGRIRSQATSKDGVTSTAIVNPNTGKEVQNGTGAAAAPITKDLQKAFAAQGGGTAPGKNRTREQVTSQLNQNLDKGDFAAIKNDAKQMAAMRSLVEKKPGEQVTSDDMGKAKERLSAIRSSQAGLAAVQSALGSSQSGQNQQQAAQLLQGKFNSGNVGALSKEEKAAAAALTGKKAEDLTGKDLKDAGQRLASSQQSLGRGTQPQEAGQAAQQLRSNLASGDPNSLSKEQKAAVSALTGKQAGEPITSSDMQAAGKSLDAIQNAAGQQGGSQSGQNPQQAMQQLQSKLGDGKKASDLSKNEKAAVEDMLGMQPGELTDKDMGRASEKMSDLIRGRDTQANVDQAIDSTQQGAPTAKKDGESALNETLGNDQWRAQHGGSENFQSFQKTETPDGKSQYSWSDKDGNQHTAMATPDGKAQIESTDAAGNSLGATTIDPNTGRMEAHSPQSSEVLPESLRSSIAAAPTGFEKPAAPVDNRDGKEVMKELSSDLRSGDYGAIEKDAGKMAMVGVIVGKDAADVTDVTRDDIKAAAAALAEDDKSGRVTAAGEFELMKRVSDANLPAFVKPETGYGAVKRKVVEGVGSSEEGVISAGPSKERSALAAELVGAGWKHVAKAILSTSTPFNFTINRGKDNNITGFEAMGGARSLSSDMATINSGKLVDYTNLTRSTTGNSTKRLEENVTLINKGVQEKNGEFREFGSSTVRYNQDKDVGAMVVTVNNGKENKEILVTGERNYAKDPQSGKRIQVSSNITNDTNADLRMFTQGADKTLKESRVQGKLNSKGVVVSGTTSNVTTSVNEEQVKGGKNVVATRQGTGGLNQSNASVRAHGGMDIDMSQKVTTGTAYTSVGNVSGSIGQGALENGEHGQLEVSQVAVASATLGNATEQAVSKVAMATTGPVGKVTRLGPGLSGSKSAPKWTQQQVSMPKMRPGLVAAGAGVAAVASGSRSNGSRPTPAGTTNGGSSGKATPAKNASINQPAPAERPSPKMPTKPRK